ASSQLAGSWRDAGDLGRAQAVAAECAARHPGSHGARFCQSLADELAEPFLQLSAMGLDGLHRRSIAISHKNVKVAYFRAFQMDLAQSASTAGFRKTFQLQQEEMKRLLASGHPAAEWTVELPPTPDLRPHRTYSTPPLDRRGLYAIAVSDRRDFAEKRSRVAFTLIVLSDLVLQASAGQGGTYEIRVLSGATGQPVSGATVEMYAENWRDPPRRVDTGTTGADGFTHFNVRPVRDGGEQLYAMARSQGDVSVHPDSLSYYGGDSTPREVSSALLYTDRSIYRPQQKVQWKVVAYHGVPEQARLAVRAGADLAVRLLDANGREVSKQEVKTNRFGSAAGAFDVPTGRLLGAWRLVVAEPGNPRTPVQGIAIVRVEEYKRPTFEVSIQDPPAPLRLNRPGKVTGLAKYYFGLPVAAGQARWKVTRQPVYPWWWGFWRPIPSAGAQTIATGTSPLKGDGTFELAFTAVADERTAARGVSYRYQVSADVTDEGGETRSGSRGFRLGTSAVEARVDLDRGFLVGGEGAPATISLLRSDLDGVPRPGPGHWRLSRLQEPAAAALPADEPEPEPEPSEGEPAPAVRTPGDRQKPRLAGPMPLESTLHGWAEGARVAEADVSHDDKGLARVSPPALRAGAYRLTYQTVDPFGAAYSVSRDFLVAGKQSTPAVAAILLAERSTVAVGETARLIAGSGLPSQPMLLEVYRGVERVLRRTVVSGKDAPLVEIPVKEADRGGFTVSLTLLRDYQWMHLTQTIHVPRDDKELKVELATFRDLVRPGARERFRVKISGREGAVAAGAAEVLAYMYDRSLDFFVPHHPPSLDNLYPERSGQPYVRANLHYAPSFAPWWVERRSVPLPDLHGDSLQFYSGYGIGGLGIRGYGPGGGGFAMAESMPVARKAQMSAGRAAAAPPDAEFEATKAEKKADTLGMALGAELPGPNAPPEPEPPPPALRQNFAETAFFQPQLLTDSSGGVTIEFTVPDSITSWNLWVHAVTADLRGGSTRRELRSAKELMVRPYVPRFMREGDRADLKVVLNSAADRDLPASVTFDVLDTERGASALDLFSGGPGKGDRRPRTVTVAKGGSATLQYGLAAPARVGQYAVKVTATSGNVSDGALRPMPVLPSRVHLVQSRFATLKDRDRKELAFADMKRTDDPSRIEEQLVVTIDAQLAYTVLEAVPFLVEYPYECTEQTLNRFVSTAILTSLFKQYPAMAKMAEKLAASRTAELETWDATDPNRKIALEETPWLVESSGGRTDRLAKVLDPRIAAAQREESIAKLRKAQSPDGSFPWWAGGPPSPYMTLYIAMGMARAAEYQVPIPKDMTQRAWVYLAGYFRRETGGDLRKLGYELLTLLDYAASAYPDDSYTTGGLSPEERRKILAFTFDHWKDHSPYLKGLLALTLKRMGRPADARLVWDSVLDSAKTTPDQGTFWAPEDRAWLWYNDTIETHAFALRVLTELLPQDPRRDGLVQWLLINKKLSHWKSTRATAEVIYALVKYLEQERALAVREELSVTIGARAPVRYAFEPDEYQGKHNQVVVPGPELQPRTDATVVVEKSTKGFAFASATWHFSTEKLPDEARGDLFSVSRRYFRRESRGREVTLHPLAEGEQIHVGDELEVQLSLRSKHAAEYVHLRDPRGAGFEPEAATSGYRWQTGLGYYEEVRDSGESFFFEWLPAGEYTFKERVRATLSGTFRVGPATVQSMYAPELNAYSAGQALAVAP
ncbi:MAG TPA: alpha-2-macroglobulin family protein, partial [Myxococcales bacterium]|nr:alpha-2-macroglobulin family protein [Myxococcales bacterium]